MSWKYHLMRWNYFYQINEELKFFSFFSAKSLVFGFFLNFAKFPTTADNKVSTLGQNVQSSIYLMITITQKHLSVDTAASGFSDAVPREPQMWFPGAQL